MDAKHEFEYKTLVLKDARKLESEVFELASGNLFPYPTAQEHNTPFMLFIQQ